MQTGKGFDINNYIFSKERFSGLFIKYDKTNNNFKEYVLNKSKIPKHITDYKVENEKGVLLNDPINTNINDNEYFEMSRTFHSESTHILNSIKFSLQQLPVSNYVLCIRYSFHNKFADTQIGISGDFTRDDLHDTNNKINVKQNKNFHKFDSVPINLNMKKGEFRELQEETGIKLNNTNDLILRSLPTYDPVTGKYFTVSTTNISLDNVTFEYLASDTSKSNIKMFVIPHVTAEHLDTFVQSLGNITNTGEKDIVSFVFIPVSELLNYCSIALQKEPIKTNKDPVNYRTNIDLEELFDMKIETNTKLELPTYQKIETEDEIDINKYDTQTQQITSDMVDKVDDIPDVVTPSTEYYV